MAGAGCRRSGCGGVRVAARRGGVAVPPWLRLEAGNGTPHGGANGDVDRGARRGAQVSPAGLEGRLRRCLLHDGPVGIPAGGALGSSQGASGDRRLCWRHVLESSRAAQAVRMGGMGLTLKASGRQAERLRKHPGEISGPSPQTRRCPAVSGCNETAERCSSGSGIRLLRRCPIPGGLRRCEVTARRRRAGSPEEEPARRA